MRKRAWVIGAFGACERPGARSALTMYPTSSAINNRILVIDDNSAIHADFTKVLASVTGGASALDQVEAELFEEVSNDPAKCQFSLDFASQGEEGWKKVQQAVADGRPYAVAFVDVRMPPGWDGIETIDRLWQTDSRLQIVLCTAYSDYSWQEISRRLGHSENLLILKKPFDNIEVVQLAHALTNKWLVTSQVKAWVEHLDAMVAERTQELHDANQQLEHSAREARRLAEVAEAASRAKSDFLTVVSHEMLTPMNGIIGLAQYLEGTALDGDQHECVADVLRSSERMLAMVREVLDFVEAEAPRTAAFTPIDLAAVARQVVADYSARAVAKGLSLACVEPTTLPVAIGEARRFTRALSGLVDNAIKFSRTGEVTVSFEVLPESGAGPSAWIRCTVRDQGVGIAAEKRDLIFRPFGQISTSLTRDFEGMGLGLALSKRLVESLGGRIGFESEFGRGSTFWIELPEAASRRQAA